MQTQVAATTMEAARISRTCGECDVCCTAMRVTALNKPAGTRCVHMHKTGCGNYENRPSACRDWYCMWLRDSRGVFNDAERPDRVGIFFTASKPSGPAGSQVIFAHPVHPNALSNPAARAMVKRLKQYAPVQMLPYLSEATPLTHEGHPLAMVS